jgi:hypothetical protein
VVQGHGVGSLTATERSAKYKVEVPGSWFGGTEMGSLTATERSAKYGRVT